ncbi:MAG: hypothetical protein RL355_397 [Actinomycetota bacterium]|jgi:uncharacterized membrane protein YkvA (DUF1232 family)
MFGRKKISKKAIKDTVQSTTDFFTKNPEKIQAILDAFPKKLTAAGKIPFAEQITAAYYALRDPKTPFKVKATIAAALAYFIMPADIIPDVIAGFGFTDDFAVLLLVLKRVSGAITEEHYESARRRLQGEEESS